MSGTFGVHPGGMAQTKRYKRYAVATNMNDKYQIVETVRPKNKPANLIGFVVSLPEDSKIAIETTATGTTSTIAGRREPGDPSYPSTQDEGDSRSEDQSR